MSFLSRPSVQRFLFAPGPLVVYPLVASFFAWAAVSAGSQSAGAVVCGVVALLFGTIAVREWRACITGRGFY